MNRLMMTAVLALLFVSGCKKMVNEREARGTLVINHAAIGNKFLEVPDKASRLTRFIHPGNKIIEINPGWNSTTFNVLDSHRVRLATLNVPKKLYAYDKKTDTFTMKTGDIPDADAGGKIWFDIAGRTQSKILRVENIARASFTPCKVDKCTGASCEGRQGSVWHVVDFRNDYVIDFLLKNTKIQYARFTARGEVQTHSELIHSKTCVPRLQVFEQAQAEVKP